MFADTNRETGAIWHRRTGRRKRALSQERLQGAPVLPFYSFDDSATLAGKSALLRYLSVE